MAQKLIRNPQLISSEIGGEVFMMDLAQDNFLGLNAVASFIWERLETPHSAEEVVTAVISSFEVPDPDAVGAEVTAFLDLMLKDEMVHYIDG